MRVEILLCCLALARAWQEHAEECDPECEKWGNCNREFGTCECPLGRLGPACEQDVLSACRPSASPLALPYVGQWLIKSCHCWEQICQRNQTRLQDKLFVLSSNRGHGEYCNVHELPCYVRDGVPPMEQYSDIPAVNASGVKWYMPLHVDPTRPLQPVAAPPTDHIIHHAREHHRQLPLDNCSKRCSERGACLQQLILHLPGVSGLLPRCHCPRGFKGRACDEPEPSHCANSCGGKGECLGGFCKCKTGFWGMDCTRSKAYRPEATTAHAETYSRTTLRIYRYELPWHVAFFHEPVPREMHTAYFDAAYGAWEQFFNQFSADWVTRTENPQEANLFYLPLHLFLRTDNVAPSQPFVQHAIQYVEKTYPGLWGRNQGKDHFFWLASDQGACDVANEPRFQNPIKIVHFGMQARAPWWEHAVHPVGDQTLSHGKGTGLGRSLHVATLNQSSYHCFLLEKDVVAPDNRQRTNDRWLQEAEQVYAEARAGAARKYLLFFGGAIRPEDPVYSGGVRLEFFKHVVNRSHEDVKFGGTNEMFKAATFCLCPYGHGFGSRLGYAMTGACIPVILQDNVHQPLDDVLHYPDFSLRLRKRDVPHMVEALRAVSKARVQEYRENMYKVYRAFTWSVPHGGLAYNYTLRSLQRKLFNLWGHHYR